MFITSWELFVEHAKKKCSKAAFDNWLAPVTVIDCSEEEVVLSIPNIFVQEYLLSNYKSELKAYLPVNAEGEPAIRFVVEAPKKTEPEAAPLAPPQPAAPKSVGGESLYQIRLNKNYKFSSFIEGASNQFIKSAAMGAATRPGLSYNPLFIHGGVGLGKTHILHSIGHYITENHAALRIQCITTEGFINDLVDNLRKKSIDQMKRFYRSEIDVLLIDDIQFLQDRLNFQEEICNTFETLINYNKQIVITSDKPPGQLKLSERMIARMEWGLVAHMGIPDLETRVAILKHKAEQKGLDLSSDIAFHIAEHIYQNVRQLEGAINRLSAHCRLLNKRITPELVQNTIGDMFQTPPGQTVSIEEILETVSKVFKVPVSDIKGKKRTDQVAIARQVAMYLAKEFVKDSLVALANYFHKSHSTVLHACRSVESKIREQDDPKLKDLKLKVGIAKRHLEHV